MSDAARARILSKRKVLAARFAAGDPLAAIRVFCIECQGGDPAPVARCDEQGCALWGQRMAAASTQLAALRRANL